MTAVAELIGVEEAQRIIARVVADGGPLAAVRVALDAAVGLTLAEAVCTDVDDPPFDRALMDGYAVWSADFADGKATLRVTGSLGAGAVPESSLQAGEALRINTGAPVPPGADAVVMVERSALSADGATVTLHDAPEPGQSITPQATHLGRNDVVLTAGTRLGAAQIAAAAAAGAATVAVHRRPRVAVLVTGNELVDIAARPGPGQIRNSNGPGLAALVQEAGCTVEMLGVAGDDERVLAERIARGLTADVLCITGGISMGQYDLVPDALLAAGVAFLVRKIAVKPGKPTIIGRKPGAAYVVALPGNPVSSLVGFWLYVEPLLSGLQGRPAAPRATMAARLTAPMRKGGGRKSYIPATVRVGADGGIEAEPVPWHGSGDPFGLARANGLMVREADAAAAEVGSVVKILPLSFWTRTDG